jgi:response regulator RpfG family c-di-GMP phosphodiesterase
MTGETKRARLLVVDDEPLSIKILAKMLGGDYEILAAGGGEEAIELSLAHLPDLIMLDVSMPGMDGYEVCRRLKECGATRDIPVIFITALEGDDHEMRGLALGAADYLQKPLNPVLLRLRVRNNLEVKLQRDRISVQMEELRKLNERLAEEMEKVRVLSGILPICCKCKKIRDGEGHWHPLESFISLHSDVLFSHGYCPKCTKEELDSYLNKIHQP